MILKKFAAYAVSAALMLGSATPAFAAVVTITNNGSGSNNTATVTTTINDTLNLTNAGDTTNDITTLTESGDVTVEDNTGVNPVTGEGILVETGDAETEVTVTNGGHDITAAACSCSATTSADDILIDGNGSAAVTNAATSFNWTRNATAGNTGNRTTTKNLTTRSSVVNVNRNTNVGVTARTGAARTTSTTTNNGHTISL